jgi:predicted kinase
MSTLHLFCGKAGAGKSTLARQLALEHGALLLSEDIWMARLYGDQMHVFDDYVRLSARLEAAIGPLCVDLLRVGQPVVLDFQANTRRRRDWVRSLFERAGAAHVLHFVDTPDERCLAQIAQRNLALPEGAHVLSVETFHHVSSFFQPPEAAEGFNVRRHGGAAASGG